MAIEFERELFFDPKGIVRDRFYANPDDTLTKASVNAQYTRGLHRTLAVNAHFVEGEGPSSIPSTVKIARGLAFVAGGELAMETAYAGASGLRTVMMPEVVGLFLANPGVRELKESDDPRKVLKDARNWTEDNIPELDMLTQAVDIYFDTYRASRNLEPTVDEAVAGFTFTAKHLMLGYKSLHRDALEVSSVDWSIPVDQMPGFENIE